MIYVVDDAACLTRLYLMLLEGAGYVVRAFNDRAEALAVLNTVERKPELLITDYSGHSMPFEQFLHQCFTIHPTLRVLMASGLSETDVRLARVRPHRYIRKPFTPDEFRREIRAALGSVDPCERPRCFESHPIPIESTTGGSR